MHEDVKTIDTIILGAGIIGTTLALQLQQRGQVVALIDRRGVGEETSYGNTGLIQSEAFMPYSFPRDPWQILKYAFNLRPEAHYQISSLTRILPWLIAHYHNATPEKILATARANAPLFKACKAAHEALAKSVGCEAMFRQDGWMRVFHTEAELSAEVIKASQARDLFGAEFTVLSADELHQREPHISPNLVGAIHWHNPTSLAEPIALTKAYFAAFQKLGGVFYQGDATRLKNSAQGWRIPIGEDNVIEAKNCVIALGAWSGAVAQKWGYAVPLLAKRGYHMHYAAEGQTMLNHPILDGNNGYMLTPMRQGIRLTTGAEFAKLDAPSTSRQLVESEIMARKIFPLGARLEAKAWRGARPCLPDMISIMDRAPRHKGLWFSFGHAHHGLTLAAIAAKLMASRIIGEMPEIDMSPYQISRFL